MKEMIRYRSAMGIALLFLASVTLSGCIVGPDYEAPELSPFLQDAWHPPTETKQFSETEPPPTVWWDQFEDKALSALVTQVFTSNRVLEQARQRVIGGKPGTLPIFLLKIKKPITQSVKPLTPDGPLDRKPSLTCWNLG